MDKQIIANKLESLRRCIKRIEQKTPNSSEALYADLDLQDILVVNISRAVQLCVDIAAHIVANSDHPAPKTMGEAFDILTTLSILDEQTASNLKKAVGFRNIATHNYDEINWDITYFICTKRINDFTSFASQIASHSLS